MKIATIAFVALAIAASPVPAGETVPLASLDLSKMRQGWGRPQIDRSIREKPLSIGGRAFQHGVGTHAKSSLWIELAGGSERFQAFVGVDDAANGPGTVVFQVIGDGKKLFDSGLMKPGDSAREVDVDVKGVRTLLLLVLDGGDGIAYDHANWAEARFVVTGERPAARGGPGEEPVILTPKPPASPRINPPRVAGARPGNPFIFRVPTTGERPIRFAAEGLPAGLVLDAGEGIIAGTTPPRGEYKVILKAKNGRGEDSRTLRIVAGDTLALTPPMGWNHWYAHYSRITDPMCRRAADILVASGMADAGYQYVSIDDCWMNSEKNDDPKRVGPLRDGRGRIVPNAHFPDMAALTEHIHSKGLRAGIYTSPGPFTCAGHAGAFGHEEEDARTFSEWGFDLLKYDWCSYGGVPGVKGDAASLQKPYRLMGDLLRKGKRDIVLNLCQYGMGEVWKWGAEVGGQSWRTSGDLGFELNRIFEVALANAEHREWSRPGSWNDPDYLQMGWIGDAHTGGEPRPCPLTPSEQYAFMSLWCLMASPLFYSGDMERLDAFTLSILTNPEVIEVDQDPRGECARTTTLSDEIFLMVKGLEDGSKAVGLGNRGEFEAKVAAEWAQLGVSGPQTVRDLWRQKDLGRFEGRFEAPVPRRGVVLVKIAPAK